MTINENSSSNTYYLDDLSLNTLYTVTVTTMYGSNKGESISGTFKTSEFLILSIYWSDSKFTCFCNFAFKNVIIS